MAEQNQTTQEQEAEVVEAPVAPGAVGMGPKEIEDGKAFAILSYVLSLVGLPFFLVPLIMRNNAFSLYHAKQCLILWLLGIVGGTVSGILMFACIGFVLLPIVGIVCLVFAIMGIINASGGQAKQLPLIGQWAEDWFKGIEKQ